MTIALGIALYFVVWWMTLFAVLPFGVRTQGESGHVVPGTPEGAPANPRLLRIVLINTLAATIVFGIIVAAMYFDVFGITAMVNRPPQPYIPR